jgi:hypothetical protein
MATDHLAATLRACAVGLYPLEAGTELLIGNGGLPCSGVERRILQLSATLAADTPVSPRGTATGLDTTPPAAHRNTPRLRKMTRKKASIIPFLGKKPSGDRNFRPKRGGQ